MEAVSGKVLVIGLDMGDAALIRRWMGEGLLPNFSEICSAGTWWDLQSPAEVLHTATWPTFATGANPGRHGVYYPFQPKPGNQLAQHVGNDAYAAPTFWGVADASGRRCLVYDVPETFPAPGFRGRAIFEWGTWAWYGEPATQPPQLSAALRTRFGKYPLGLEATRLGLRFPEKSRLERGLIAGVAHKAESLAWMLGDEPWDLAVAAFCETHPAGHYLWPENGTASDSAERLSSVRNVYVAIDAAIGTVRRALPEGTRMMIVSGDGVRANHCGWHLLPEIMRKLGFSVPQKTEGGQERGGLLNRVKKSVPPGARRWIADRLPSQVRDRINSAMEGAGLDWAATRAFTLPTDLEGYIRINLEGREPAGCVKRGSDYAATCREISDRLMELTNPATGRGAVKRVWSRDEVFPGAAADHLPDLIVTWDDSSRISAVTSPRFGTIEMPSPDPRTGTHSPRAFLAATGPGIRAGEHGNGRLVDVAPTVLGMLGIAAEGMEGRRLVH